MALRGSNGREHPVLADVGCRNTVFGAEAQSSAPYLPCLRNAGIAHFRLEFAHESAAEVAAVTQAFHSALTGTYSAGQLEAQLARTAPQGTTEGSLFIANDYNIALNGI